VVLFEESHARVEVPSTGDTRIFRLDDRVRIEVSSDTVVLVPEA